MFSVKKIEKPGLYQYLGENSGFDFDVELLVMAPNEERDFLSETKETAFLLFEGEIELSAEGRSKRFIRKSVFSELPSGLHVCANCGVHIKALSHSEIYIQKTTNSNSFPAVFYHPEDIIIQRAGCNGELNGCMERSIRTLFDDDNAPYSNMVLGEVTSPPGLWSSYPPHHHPQPEAYFYRFSDPRGFGFGFDGENVVRTVHNSLLFVSNDGTHEQVTAPGYAVSYVWGILHLPGDRWLKTRIDDPQHVWLRDPDVQILQREDIL